MMSTESRPPPGPGITPGMFSSGLIRRAFRRAARAECGSRHFLGEVAILRGITRSAASGGRRPRRSGLTPGGPAELAEPPFSRRELRDALGMFATGVAIITTRGADGPYGMTANAFCAVSLDPPLVLICVMDGTRGAAAIAANRHFSVNVLAAEQEALSRHFASRDGPRGREAFAEIPHRAVATGAPVIEGAAAYLDCLVASGHEAGDHVIFVGHVLAIGTTGCDSPLLYFSGTYRSL
jgi:flavin reductase